MELKTVTVSASTLKIGQENSIPVAAGQTLQVRRHEGGPQVDVVSTTCPVGKAWSARVILEITETDA